MILYLSSTQHTNLLDFTGWYGTNSEMPIKKMVGSFILKQFIIYDMRNFSHFSEVILDRIAFGDDDEDFAKAIEEFLIMYNPRVTVICEGLQENSPLFQALLNCGVGNIVCDTEITAIQREIEECLSEEGMTRYHPKERIQAGEKSQKNGFDCENVHISVISSQPRMGATTAAIGLSSWLTSEGASVCYMEDNNSRFLASMTIDYDMEQDGNGWRLDGVFYSNSPIDESVNFIVHDIGNVTSPNDMLHNADLVLAVCGTKPHELPHSMILLKRVKEKEAFVLCPFTHEKVQGDYAAFLQTDLHKVLFLEYQPELTDGKSNDKVYRTIMKKYSAGAQCSGG